MQASLIFFGYALIFVGTVLLMHFQIIDSNAGSVILGGILTHLGFQGLPSLLPPGNTNQQQQPPSQK